jgi:hypothetical protein
VSRRRGGGGAGGGSNLPAIYEGPEVLTALLAQAGSPVGTEEVARRFADAQRAGEPRGPVIASLFPEEPRFASPDGARRLYGNLFGLWERLAKGLGPHDDAPDVLPEPRPARPLPARGSLPGPELTPELVEAVWMHLADAPPREVQRQRDRWQNLQPDLAAWLDAAPLAEAAAAAASDLAFEAWAMFDQAFGDRLRAVDWKDLRALEPEPPPLDVEQPALAAYVVEQLDTLADEDPAFGEEQRAQLEKVMALVAAALGEAVQEPS